MGLISRMRWILRISKMTNESVLFVYGGFQMLCWPDYKVSNLIENYRDTKELVNGR